MKEEVVARRYADALFQLGQEKGTQDNLIHEFLIVRNVFRENEQIIPFLKHPRVSNAEKKQFLEDVFQGMSTDVINTLKMLVERHRIVIIPSIIDHLNHLDNDAKGIAEAIAYSVRALSDQELEQISQSCEDRVNKRAVKLENEVDPSIIGGIKIRMGNTIYDGSISGKLKRIERSIGTAN